MARASYRRRSDGIIQIVRPSPFQRLGPSTRQAAAAFGVALLAVTGLALYRLLGVPFLLFAGCCAFTALLFLIGKDRPPVEPPVASGTRRTAP